MTLPLTPLAVADPRNKTVEEIGDQRAIASVTWSDVVVRDDLSDFIRNVQAMLEVELNSLQCAQQVVQFATKWRPIFQALLDTVFAQLGKDSAVGEKTNALRAALATAVPVKKSELGNGASVKSVAWSLLQWLWPTGEICNSSSCVAFGLLPTVKEYTATLRHLLRQELAVAAALIEANHGGALSFTDAEMLDLWRLLFEQHTPDLGITRTDSADNSATIVASDANAPSATTMVYSASVMSIEVLQGFALLARRCPGFGERMDAARCAKVSDKDVDLLSATNQETSPDAVEPNCAAVFALAAAVSTFVLSRFEVASGNSPKCSVLMALEEVRTLAAKLGRDELDKLEQRRPKSSGMVSRALAAKIAIVPPTACQRDSGDDAHGDEMAFSVRIPFNPLALVPVQTPFLLQLPGQALSDYATNVTVWSRALAQ
jgi:hypothetical protein